MPNWVRRRFRVRVRRFIVIGGGDTGVFYVRQLRRAVACRPPRDGGDRRRRPRRRLLRLAGVAGDSGPTRGGELVRLAVRVISMVSDCRATNSCPTTGRRICSSSGWVDTPRRPRAPTSSRGTGSSGEVGTPVRARDRAMVIAPFRTPHGLCPPTCIEPDLCPHTRGPKDWSLVERLRAPGGRADEARDLEQGRSDIEQTRNSIELRPAKLLGKNRRAEDPRNLQVRRRVESTREIETRLAELQAVSSNDHDRRILETTVDAECLEQVVELSVETTQVAIIESLVIAQRSRAAAPARARDGEEHLIGASNRRNMIQLWSRREVALPPRIRIAPNPLEVVEV